MLYVNWYGRAIVTSNCFPQAGRPRSTGVHRSGWWMCGPHVHTPRPPHLSHGRDTYRDMLAATERREGSDIEEIEDWISATRCLTEYSQHYTYFSIII